MTAYTLPDGFRIESRCEAPEWNGFPVPVLGARDFDALRAHLDTDDAEPYTAAYSTEYALPGYVADGLQWQREDDTMPVSVCIDCALLAANDEPPLDRADTEPAPLALLDAGDTLVVGSADEEPHFSWSPCQACGSTLGGDRFDAVIFPAH